MLRAYTRVVDRGSFTAVAQELGVKQSTVSKWMQALEQEVDAQLIERTTRAHHVTEAGHRFHAHARRILEAYDAAIASVQEDEAALRGRVRISLPEVFGRLHIVGPLARLAQKNPDLSLELVFADHYVNLVEEGFDLAIRLGQPKDSTLRVHHLGESPRRLVASPGYVRRRGAPSCPAALAEHECLPHSGALGATWTFSRRGHTEQVHVHGRITATNSEATLALARRGLGVALLAGWLADADLRAGRLVPLLEQYTPPRAKITALTPPGRYTPPRVRAVIEHLAG